MTVLKRKTRETDVSVELTIGGVASNIGTSIQFLDHMLTTLSRYSGVGMTVAATGDMKHHIIEDVAITIGTAISQIVPPSAARYGDRTIPMDDALVSVVLDGGGRAYYRGPLPSSLYEHFMRSLAENAGMTLHVRVLRGEDRHHIVEAAFKALGLALRDALKSSGDNDVFSTKGSVSSESVQC
jgi:imidazoleglycerol-phosphate dehydratase